MLRVITAGQHSTVCAYLTDAMIVNVELLHTAEVEIPARHGSRGGDSDEVSHIRV